MQNRLVTFISALAIASTLLLPSMALAEDKQAPQEKTIDGKLLLPDSYDTGKEKKCLTVCEEWGEDCILNPATGSRKCRRVCKSFAEECF